MTPIERLGIEIADSNIAWPSETRRAWEMAHEIETKCHNLLNRAVSELAMSPHPEAKMLLQQIEDFLESCYADKPTPQKTN